MVGEYRLIRPVPLNAHTPFRRHANAVKVGPEITAARRSDARRFGLHHLTKGRLKFLHLCSCAHGNANVRGPHWPGAPDKDIADSHRIDDFFGRTLGVQHEAIRSGWRVAVAAAIEESEGIGTHRGI